jgi:hypothetical protein
LPCSTATNGCATQLAREWVSCMREVQSSHLMNYRDGKQRSKRTCTLPTWTTQSRWFARAHPLAPSLFLRRPLLMRYVDDELSHEHILSTNYHADGERNPSSEMMFLSLPPHSHNDALFRYPTRPVAGSSPDTRARLDLPHAQPHLGDIRERRDHAVEDRTTKPIRRHTHDEERSNSDSTWCHVYDWR